jgi:hypothetical protein
MRRGPAPGLRLAKVNRALATALQRGDLTDGNSAPPGRNGPRPQKLNNPRFSF